MSSLPPPSSVPPPQPVPAEAGAPAQPAPLRPDDRSDEPPWPVWTAPAAVLVGLVVGVLGSVVVAGIGAAAGSTSTTPAVSLISDVVFDLGFVATALYFASTTGDGWSGRRTSATAGSRCGSASARSSRRAPATCW